ncbi:hypothetical protein E2C01_082171 [Portunus trituberculatus]|uniref:Uncharacterized protein n=1 Tax=Portunus trituberculatus TaxID=210409 RepID=A0A5B7IYH7_PORTR|nr:hypothetical protein [Portunus trituberculatus]
MEEWGSMELLLITTPTTTTTTTTNLLQVLMQVTPFTLQRYKCCQRRPRVCVAGVESINNSLTLHSGLPT